MHKKIVSNTTPILSLLKIGKLQLLKELYGCVSVPFAVFQEIESGKDKDYYVDISKIEWIKIETIKAVESKSFFFDLDEGEAEVLILAFEQQADLVIMDEIVGRRYATQMNMNLTGTLGVLLKGKQNGHIYKITPLLNELVNKNSWIAPKLIAKVVEMAGE